MTTPTFTWHPDASLSKNVEPRVTSAKFGDGYEQRAQVGLNPILEVWSVTFTGLPVEINAIEAFLKDAGGYRAFNWTTPEEMTGRFVVRKWKKTRERGVKVNLSFDMEQVPE